MDLVARYTEYVDAFEETFADENWDRLDQYFTEDAVYHVPGDPPFAGTWEGRSTLLDHIRESVNGFDRLFDERVPVEITDGPRSNGGQVEIGWKATYPKAGAPDLVIEGTEHATFEGDRIARLEDRFAQGSAKRVGEYMEKYFS